MVVKGIYLAMVVTYLAIKVMCTTWQDKVACVVGRPGQRMNQLFWLVPSAIWQPYTPGRATHW